MRFAPAWSPFLLQQQPGDPVPFGPSTWTGPQWWGLLLYVALFLTFVWLVYRLARPRPAAPEERAGEEPACCERPAAP